MTPRQPERLHRRAGAIRTRARRGSLQGAHADHAGIPSGYAAGRLAQGARRLRHHRAARPHGWGRAAGLHEVDHPRRHGRKRKHSRARPPLDDACIASPRRARGAQRSDCRDENGYARPTSPLGGAFVGPCGDRAASSPMKYAPPFATPSAGSRLTEMGRDRAQGLLSLRRRPGPVEDDPRDALGRQERDRVRFVHAATD